jgi:regulator of sirC expression with transglutaminase-like and TPR domain
MGFTYSGETVSGGVPRQRFADLVDGREGEVDLAHAALLISAEENGGVEVERWLAHLDALADELRPRIAALPAGPGSDFARLAELSVFLFAEQGFSGNRDDYYDPANSFLDRVLERRTGIPITLALVMIEVGRRVGVPLVGVGFPGHFLVRHARHPDLLLDPFAGGRLVSDEDCRRLLAQVCGDLPFHPRLLRPVSGRCLLQRMLTNLRAIYMSKGDLCRTVAVLDRILLLAPGDAVHLRERGLLRLRCADAGGLEDLTHYLEIEPEAPDREALYALVQSARGRYMTVH